MLGSIFPTVANYFMSHHLAIFEEVGSGLTKDNAKLVYKNFAYNDGIFMLIVSFLVFTLLGLYLDNVMKSEYGIPKPYNYFLKASYW